jgi:hypothetical protein
MGLRSLKDLFRSLRGKHGPARAETAPGVQRTPNRPIGPAAPPTPRDDTARPADALAQAAQPPAPAPAPRPESPPAPKASKKNPHPDTAALLRRLDEQQRQLQQALDRLGELPGAVRAGVESAASALGQAGREGDDRISELAADVRRLGESAQEIVEGLGELTAEGRRQGELLEAVRGALGDLHQSALRRAEGTARLGEAIASLEKSNAAHIEIAEQIRDRWATARENIVLEIEEQGKRTARLLMVLVGVTAVVGGLLLVAVLAAG